MRFSSVIAALSLGALVSMTGCSGCRQKLFGKGAPSANASANARASASVAPSSPVATLPIVRPNLGVGHMPMPASASAGPPVPVGDPVFVDITHAQPVTSGVVQSFKELGLHWTTPPGWITEDYVPAAGRPHEKRRTSRSPGNNAFFDILVANVENQKTLMWKGNDFPPVGMKPDGGEEQHDRVPFASVSLGEIAAVGSHYTDGSYTYAWIFFSHPRTKQILQIILTWSVTDDVSRRAIANIAGSVSAD